MWYLTVRGECRLRVFENRILRRIFGLRTKENWEWRRLHNEELHTLYQSPNILRVITFRRLRWVRHLARMKEGEIAFRILTSNPTRKRPLGRPVPRRKNNVRMDLKEIGVNVRDWINLAQDRYCQRALVNAALNLQVT